MVVMPTIAIGHKSNFDEILVTIDVGTVHIPISTYIIVISTVV